MTYTEVLDFHRRTILQIIQALYSQTHLLKYCLNKLIKTNQTFLNL